MSKQSTSHLFMIEPDSFYANEQTSYTNHYQVNQINETPEEIAKKALKVASDICVFTNNNVTMEKI